MRVAQVMAGAADGGAELFFERLTVALREEGDDVLPVIRRNPRRAALLRAAGLRPQELAFGPPYDLLTPMRLRRSLRRFAPEVVVSWMSRATAQTPVGDWMHVGRLGGYYDLRHYRYCDYLVGNTRSLVAWLREAGWPVARTRYLPNFVEDCSLAAPSADLPAEQGPWLLGLGRLHTDKGFDTLLRALPALPGVNLAIAGDGPERAALQALARAEGVASRVRFLGWRRDAAALLRAAHIFVCSSRIEPLGNMVIEAWSARCPVVALAAAGPRELIRNGIDGLLCRLECPDALAAAVKGLLTAPDEMAALTSAGRTRFEDEFSRNRVVALWRGFLAEVATG